MLYCARIVQLQKKLKCFEPKRKALFQEFDEELNKKM